MQAKWYCCQITKDIDMNGIFFKTTFVRQKQDFHNANNNANAKMKMPRFPNYYKLL